MIAEAPLLAAADVNRAGAFSLFFRAIGDFFAGLWQAFINIFI